MALLKTTQDRSENDNKKIDRIREILIGQKYREIEDRLSGIGKNIKDYQEKTSQDLLNLKSYLEILTDEKTDNLKTKISELQAELKKSQEKFEYELNEMKSKAEKHIKLVEDQLKKKWLLRTILLKCLINCRATWANNMVINDILING